MNFDLDPQRAALRDRVAAFVRDVVIPAEHEPVTPQLVASLRERAKREGLYGPQLPKEYGGLGLGTVAMCALFEQAGRSFLGPIALHCAAPDEGNMHLLAHFASAEQKERWLKPLVEGTIRSCFAMTEPAPGAGSDPTMMQTRATRVDGGWSITGRKWFTTGADGASLAVTMAVTDPAAEKHRSATMFLVPTDTPGYRFVRNVPVMGSAHDFGGHGEVDFDNVVVPDDAVVGAIGDGFRLAQVRLGPARLTHCMRWMGIAQRALEIAVARAKERAAFGKKLAEQEAVQWMLADSEIELHASRLMVMDAAWRHEQGGEIRHESSICKVFVAEAVNKIIDRAIQVCGAYGVSGDLPLEHFFREARAFRIYDGPSEVHRMVIARNVLKR
jgi:acyl-CoA dehydrogenase